MAINQRRKVAYGLSEPLPGIFPDPIVSTRNPTANDRAPLGQIWANRLTNDFFVLTSIVGNISTWSSQSNGAGIFASLTATAGDITADVGDVIVTLGNIVVNAGDITAAGDIRTTAGNFVADVGNITASAGNIVATAGDIIATAGDITATAGNLQAPLGNVQAGLDVIATGDVLGATIYATGDSGGLALTNGFTNVVDTTQGAGVMTILSSNGNPGNNAGYIKFYVGATAVFVPYFLDITP